MPRPVRASNVSARNARASSAIKAALVAAALPLGMAALPQAATAGGMYETARHDFVVGVDQSKALVLNGSAAIVTVGNPSIADAIVQGSDLLLIVGRSFGATNVIVFDSDGNEMASMIVNVVDASPRLVTLNRGVNRYSYNCAPECERILKVGDEHESVKAVSEQTQLEFGLATGAAEATAKGDPE